MTKFILPLLFILVSCSSVIHTPQNRMLSPEAQGKFLSGSVEARMSATKQDKWEFKNNNTHEPFDGDATVYKMAGLLDLGLLERMDFYYSDYLSGSTVGIYGLKYQILGKTRKDTAKGNFSLSLAAGYGQNSSTWKSSDADFSNWTTNVDQIKYNLEHGELGLIAGYRWAPKLLHYANAYYFHQYLRGKVTTDNNVLQDAKFKSAQEGMIYSMGLSYDLGTNWFIKADFSHMTAKWNTFRGSTSNAVNGGIGLTW